MIEGKSGTNQENCVIPASETLLDPDLVRFVETLAPVAARLGFEAGKNQALEPAGVMVVAESGEGPSLRLREAAI